MRPPDPLGMDPLYGFSWYLLNTLFDVAFRGEVVGLGNLPPPGPVLIAANHASHLDPPLIGSQIARQIDFFARRTLWKPGWASWWLDGVGAIPVDRDGGSDVTAIRRVLATLEQGRAVILFPEGTRSPDGALQPAKPGVGLLACKAQVPVVPVRIFESHRAFGRDGRLRLGTPVSIVIGRPLSPAAYDDPKAGRDRYPRAAATIMAAIAGLSLPPPCVI